MNEILKERFLVLNIIQKYLEISYFKNQFKAAQWLDIPNPHLGGFIPKTLILMGKADKVWSYILESEYERGELEV